ncbi:hypothetical protein R69927_05888 [Paraburkholderia domus]|uniref:hypothetical protein n=1 Tax=Paraburkholderia domus TaxID=2793075 RepID=UPI001913D099|nr:hypothetical protein [Paraburkholderia domus]MBK5090601.1 hypothetical protein [Burkholderia sp. R-69927]CAE6909164.1 hypothetical protein R69927_05888 [Paraburkholderia domus]
MSQLDLRACRPDLIANFRILACGLVVMATGWRYADLVVGLAIAGYVSKKAVAIWHRTSESSEDGSVLPGH